jgi:hypothetical protein
MIDERLRYQAFSIGFPVTGKSAVIQESPEAVAQYLLNELDAALDRSEGGDPEAEEIE